MEAFTKLEAKNQTVHQKDQADFTQLVSLKEQVIDQKRELEFDLLQMADRNDRAKLRGDQQLDDVRKQIRGQKSAQDSIKMESKFDCSILCVCVSIVKVTKEQTKELIAESTKQQHKLTEELQAIQQKIRVQTIVKENQQAQLHSLKLQESQRPAVRAIGQAAPSLGK